MKDDYPELQCFVDDMKATSSSNNKKQILQKYAGSEFIMKVLYYTNSPYITYGVTSSAFEKFVPNQKSKDVDGLFDLLDKLAQRIFTGHDALNLIDAYILKNPGYKHLILNIIDKDIETRANTSLINKVFPGHVPEFKVALANAYKEKYVDHVVGDWYASRKLDGVRAICRIDEKGEIQFYSRTGKKFETLQVIKSAMYNLGLKDIVLDGELCIEKDGLEDFQSVIKEVRKGEHTIKNPMYYIFDALTLDEFDTGTSKVTLTTRLQRIPKIKHCKILGQVKVNNKLQLEDIQEDFISKGYEGTMLRKDTGYKGKRSNDLLKLKKFQDAEYKVQSTINDNMRFFEDGEDVERETLAAVEIKHKGNTVKVGSGFTKDQRAFYYQYPDEIIGKIITVQYFEETTNEKGDVSLRFPTLKIVHGKERTT